MKITLTASTGVALTFWRQEDDMFCARLARTADEAQICLAVDLFEVIAELAGLDLDDPREGVEAVELAEECQQRLKDVRWYGELGGEPGRWPERERG